MASLLRDRRVRWRLVTVFAALGLVSIYSLASYSPLDANPWPPNTPTASITATPVLPATATPSITPTPTSTPTLMPEPPCVPSGPPAEPNEPPPSMSLRVYCDTEKTGLVCDIGAFGRKCEIATDLTFAVEVVASGPPVDGYSAFRLVIQYTGRVTLNEQTGFGESKSPICSLASERVSPGRYELTCKAVPPLSGQRSMYNGAIANVHFTCDGGPAQIDIVAGDANQSLYVEQGPESILLLSRQKGAAEIADSVHINCTPEPERQPEPGDTDGDGCSDQRESGSDEVRGGQRDFLNEYDFYDVNGDAMVDLSNDILGVIIHYAPSGQEAEYDVTFDRGQSAGPKPWNMTAPDGIIDFSNDILGVIRQFGHDCR